ncbi:MAG TPA: hypothetical protein VK043_11735 [Burkholderiales bacterium]|nr:hypothetical protein [Burkholderiales bacterium]
MAESGTAITRFDFTSGPSRGTHITLYPTCLVHRGDAGLETIALDTLAAVRVQFQRNLGSIGWAAALLVLALVLFAISGPLASVAAAAAAELASATSGVAAALHGVLRVVEAVANALPGLAFIVLLGAAALAALGWLGETALWLAFAGGERRYVVRGRNATLLDFAEAISTKLMQSSRG